MEEKQKVKLDVCKNSDDHDVFEIKDFTTASDWERFISAIEMVLQDWQLVGENAKIVKIKLNEPDIENIKWNQSTTTAEFADYSFNVTHHYMIIDDEEKEVKNRCNTINEESEEPWPQYTQDMLEKTNDFPEKSHCIARWYGLKQFVVVSPGPKMDDLLSVSRAKLVLSSLSVAANNIECQVPLFVQIKSAAEKMFIGVGVGAGIRTDFDMAHVRSVRKGFKILSDLVGIVNEKLLMDFFDMKIEPTMRMTYVLPEWPYSEGAQNLPNISHNYWNVDDNKMLELPFGAVNDTGSLLQLSCVWHGAPGSTKEENMLACHLTLEKCTRYSVRLVPSPPPICLMTDNLKTFQNTSRCLLSIVQILGHEFDPFIEEANIGTAFDRLTEDRIPTIASVVSKVRTKGHKIDNITGPIPDEKLAFLLDLLFPGVKANHPYPEQYSKVPSWNPQIELLPQEHPLKSLLLTMKSCPVDSFLWRLTMIFCHLMQVDVSLVAYLLYKVKRKLRNLWDTSELIPGVPDEPPNLSTCLLNQKLQMLNFCIKKRRAREGKDKVVPTEDAVEDEEDEFFECEEELDEMSDESEIECDSSIPEWDQPEGRMRKLATHKLIHHSRFIYVPLTQEPTPLTEDRIDARNEELLSFDTDPDGSSMKAKLMASNLLSDMECFKAANPGAIFEDFIRWYSPRDWTISDDIKNRYGRLGKLSERMSIPDNLWQELWRDSQPVPAGRQRRLYDDTREAEIVFEGLNWMGPGNFCKQLLGVCAHAAVCRLAQEPILYTLPACTEDPNLPKPQHCNTLLSQLEMVTQRLLRISKIEADPSMFKPIFDSVSTIETCLVRARMLRYKLTGSFNVTSASFTPSFSQQAQQPGIKMIDLLEPLVCQLLNQEVINMEGPFEGAAAELLVSFFEKAREKMKENEEHVVRPGLVEGHNSQYIVDKLTTESAKEYILRVKCASPEEWSRVLPHRIFAVVMNNDYRLATSITKDTVFC